MVCLLDKPAGGWLRGGKQFAASVRVPIPPIPPPTGSGPEGLAGPPAPAPAPRPTSRQEDKAAAAKARRWAMLIKKGYNADPLECPKCGATMRVISFIEARQDDVIRKILNHCGLWEDPPPRAPPPLFRPSNLGAQGDGTPPAVMYEVDPDFLEHTRREQFFQPELPWYRPTFSNSST